MIKKKKSETDLKGHHTETYTFFILLYIVFLTNLSYLL